MFSNQARACKDWSYTGLYNSILSNVIWCAQRHIGYVQILNFKHPAQLSHAHSLECIQSLKSLQCGRLCWKWSSAVLWSNAVLPAGQNLKPEDVAELQRMAENVSLIADRRAAFIALFLGADEST